MAKLTLTDPTAGYNSSTVITANNDLIEAAIENTLSRDGTSPNAMAAALDMNSNKINNLTDGTTAQDAVTVSQLNSASLGTPVVTASVIDAESSTDGYVLTSDGAGNAVWEVTAASATYTAANMDAEASTDGWVLTSDGAGNAAWEANVSGTAWTDVVDAVITPDADGTRDFGLTGTRFATAYVDNLDVTTNIVVGGTVDGRDLATDGTKLDAIEAAADVTDTANVTAAGALMDSEVDADIKTLVLPASTTISAFGATIVDDADAAAVLTTLGVDTDVATLSVPASTTISAFGATLVDDADAAAARTTLAIDAIAPAHGEMTISGNATATTVSVSDTYYQVVAGWTTGDVEDVTFSTNELAVGTTGLYFVSCSFSFTGAAADTFTFAIADTDTPVASTAIQRTTPSTDKEAVHVQGILSLTAADTVQLYGKNNADTDNFTVTDANFTIFRIG